MFVKIRYHEKSMEVSKIIQNMPSLVVLALKMLTSGEVAHEIRLLNQTHTNHRINLYIGKFSVPTVC
jgi:hypothetical protein